MRERGGPKVVEGVEKRAADLQYYGKVRQRGCRREEKTRERAREIERHKEIEIQKKINTTALHQIIISCLGQPTPSY